MLPSQTERLTFRTWRTDDLPLARALFGDPAVTALVGGPFDDAQIAARLATEISTEQVHGFQYWPVFSGDDHAGCCGLKPKRTRLHELGFYLRPAYWNRGLAVEAARSVIAFAFATFDIDGLFAGHHPDNHGSRGTLEKLGFRYTHHEHYPPTGLEHPCYELLR